MIYAVNGTLYGYDFRKNSSPVILATFLDEEITAIYNDIVSEQQMEDYFYVATYKREAKNGRGGTVRKYSVEDTPEQIKITEELVWKEFPRVKFMLQAILKRKLKIKGQKYEKQSVYFMCRTSDNLFRRTS